MPGALTERTVEPMKAYVCERYGPPEVLRLVETCGLSLQGVHSGQNATENAYLQLLQEDEAHGFHR